MYFSLLLSFLLVVQLVGSYSCLIRIRPTPLALKAQSPNHRTTGEFLLKNEFFLFSSTPPLPPCLFPSPLCYHISSWLLLMLTSSLPFYLHLIFLSVAPVVANFSPSSTSHPRPSSLPYPLHHSSPSLIIFYCYCPLRDPWEFLWETHPGVG